MEYVIYRLFRAGMVAAILAVALCCGLLYAGDDLGAAMRDSRKSAAALALRTAGNAALASSKTDPGRASGDTLVAECAPGLTTLAPPGHGTGTPALFSASHTVSSYDTPRFGRAPPAPRFAETSVTG